VRDPVCGMEIDPAEARGHERVADVDYWFCCEGCLAEFRAGRGRGGAAPRDQLPR